MCQKNVPIPNNTLALFLTFKTNWTWMNVDDSFHSSKTLFWMLNLSFSLCFCIHSSFILRHFPPMFPSICILAYSISTAIIPFFIFFKRQICPIYSIRSGGCFCGSLPSQTQNQSSPSLNLNNCPNKKCIKWNI